MAPLEDVQFMGVGIKGKGWGFVAPSTYWIFQLRWDSMEWVGHRHSSVFWSLGKFLKPEDKLLVESLWQGRGQGSLETKKLHSV